MITFILCPSHPSFSRDRWLAYLLEHLHHKLYPLCIFFNNTESLQTLDRYLWSPDLPFLPHAPAKHSLSTHKHVHLIDTLPTDRAKQSTVINASHTPLELQPLKEGVLKGIEWVTHDVKDPLRSRYKHYKTHNIPLETVQLD